MPPSGSPTSECRPRCSSGLENTSSTWSLPLPCKSPYPCVGNITARAKTLGKVRTSARRKGAPVFGGPVSVRPRTTAKLRGKLTRTGRRLLKRHRRLKVSVAVNLFTPTGKRVTTKRTATLKLPARRR